MRPISLIGDFASQDVAVLFAEARSPLIPGGIEGQQRSPVPHSQIFGRLHQSRSHPTTSVAQTGHHFGELAPVRLIGWTKELQGHSARQDVVIPSTQKMTRSPRAAAAIAPYQNVAASCVLRGYRK